MTRRKSKSLSPEERDLWSKVTRNATPLHDRPKSRPRAQKGEVGPAVDPARSDMQARPVPEFRIGQDAGYGHVAHDVSPSISERLSHAPVRMDHGTYRRMLRGKLKPEGRIDLHGMTLSQAHSVLNAFIRRSHADGKRLVLVITGKGKDRDDPGPIPIRRGVLRHQVPHWLTAPPLGALVLDIREAHLRHGGAGALYVYLKKPL